jgi:hypothetical protein
MIIEQQQILTTQNLAVLFDGLELRKTFEGRLPDLQRECFAWICKRLQMRAGLRHAQLIHIKNAAYAWRQMIFFLSLCSEAETQSFIAWAWAHLRTQSPEFHRQFAVALSGLELAVAGSEPGNSRNDDQQGKVFLGWSADKHWLMPQDLK